jgi:hypothetical protein
MLVLPLSWLDFRGVRVVRVEELRYCPSGLRSETDEVSLSG